MGLSGIFPETNEEARREVGMYIVIIIEELIQEIESQGKDSVTTLELRKFIHNMETNTKVIDKQYKGKIDN